MHLKKLLVQYISHKNCESNCSINTKKLNSNKSFQYVINTDVIFNICKTNK